MLVSSLYLIRYDQDLLIDDTRRSMVVKSVLAKKNHPYRYLGIAPPEHWDLKRLQKEARRFYEYSYRNEDFSIVLISNKNHDFKAKDEIVQRIREITSNNHNTETRNKIHDKEVDLGLPFDDLPKILFLGSESRDSLRMSFQIKTTLKDEVIHESIKYVVTAMRHALRKALYERKLVISFKVSAEYFDYFSLVHVDLEPTSKSKRNPILMMVVVFKAIDYLKINHNSSHYGRINEDLWNIYNTMSPICAKQLAYKIARNFKKVGLLDCLRFGNTLNYYSATKVNNILNSMEYSQMVLIVSSNFTTRPIDSVDLSHSLDLFEAFQSSFISTPNKKQKRTPKTERIELRNKDPQTRMHFMVKQISYKFLNELELVKKGLDHISFRGGNPYNITDEFTLHVKGDESHYYRKKIEPSRVELINKVLYYRYNPIFSLNQTALVLKLSLANRLSKLTKGTLKYDAFLLILAKIWEIRLSQTKDYVEEYNGKLRFSVKQDHIQLQIQAADLHFKKILRDTLEKINLEENPLAGKEIREAREIVIRELWADKSSFRHLDSEIDRLTFKGRYSTYRLSEYINRGYFLIKEYKSNPRVSFGLIEGTIGLDNPKKVFEKVLEVFEM